MEQISYSLCISSHEFFLRVLGECINLLYPHLSITISLLTDQTQLKRARFHFHLLLSAAGAMYTIMLVDPDINYAPFGTMDHPFLHMLLANIPGAQVSNGQTLASYYGPAPASGTHRYYFLLYRQMDTVNITDVTGYTRSCPGPTNR